MSLKHHGKREVLQLIDLIWIRGNHGGVGQPGLKHWDTGSVNIE